MNQNATEIAEGLRKQWSAMMTEEEVTFLRDVAGFIDFAIRSGLTFPMTVSAIVHDVNEIARAGFDFGTARAHGFQPKVEGFSKIPSDAFEGTEDDE